MCCLPLIHVREKKSLIHKDKHNTFSYILTWHARACARVRATPRMESWPENPGFGHDDIDGPGIGPGCMATGKLAACVQLFQTVCVLENHLIGGSKIGNMDAANGYLFAERN